MSYAALSHKYIARPPFFQSIWRDVKASGRRLFKEWMAWFDITV